MNKRPKNKNTVNSFLAGKGIEYRQRQADELNIFVHKIIEKENSVRFIMYWGAANKKYLDKYDYSSLINLFAFINAFEKQYKVDVKLTLIFTDTHAALNGYQAKIYNTYFKNINHIVSLYNYDTLLMSDILRPFLHSNNINSFDHLLLSILKDVRENGAPQYLYNNDSFVHLKDSAAKHSIRYKENYLFNEGMGLENVEQAALAYIKLNQIEKILIEKRFSQSILITYNSYIEKTLIAPDIPSVQIYSFQKGNIGRPWFMSNILEVIE